ncbi:MAG: L-threonylcarbamoyladenylate synthase [Patescibacteria group bacterium]
MEILNLKKQGVTACVREAIKKLRAGGVILYPTDTLYGLGADALSDEAVGKIYEIKGRDKKKPIHAIITDIKMMEKYAEVSDLARTLAKELLPGPLTLILKKKVGIKTGIAKGRSKIGFRIPDNQFCLALAKKFGKPLTTTSANKSGSKTERTVKAILKQLGSAKERISLVIDAGKLPDQLPSTVVDMTGNEPIILREGAIPVADIWNAIRVEM